jgi:hypothetical protein
MGRSPSSPYGRTGEARHTSAGLPTGRRHREREKTVHQLVTDRPAPLADQELARIDAWWRAATYLTVGQIYPAANPLLREPLRPEHIKRACSATGARRPASTSSMSI